ncbi:hypothetical protein D3C72_1775190 [compost metagenome]
MSRNGLRCELPFDRVWPQLHPVFRPLLELVLERSAAERATARGKLWPGGQFQPQFPVCSARLYRAGVLAWPAG